MRNFFTKAIRRRLMVEVNIKFQRIKSRVNKVGGLKVNSCNPYTGVLRERKNFNTSERVWIEILR